LSAILESSCENRILIYSANHICASYVLPLVDIFLLLHPYRPVNKGTLYPKRSPVVAFRHRVYLCDGACVPLACLLAVCRPLCGTMGTERQVDGDRFCVTEMPTCRGYPSAGGPNHPKGRVNKGAGRENQQEILGSAPSSGIVCEVAVCTAHSSTSWPACRHTLFTLFFRPQSSLNCRMRHLHGGDTLRLLIAIV